MEVTKIDSWESKQSAYPGPGCYTTYTAWEWDMLGINLNRTEFSLHYLYDIMEKMIYRN